MSHSHFRQIVREEMQDGLKQILLPCQGLVTYISPSGKVCTVRIPLPRGGVQAGAFDDKSYHELENVPMPRSTSGVIDAWLSQLMDALGRKQQPSVLVGFKGGNIQFPYIITFLDLIPTVDTLIKQMVPDAQGIVTNGFKTAKMFTLGAGFASLLPFAGATGMTSGVPGQFSPLGQAFQFAHDMLFPPTPRSAAAAQAAKGAQSEQSRALMDRTRQFLPDGYRLPVK